MNFREILLFLFTLFSLHPAFSQSSTDSLVSNVDSLVGKISLSQPTYKTFSVRAKMIWEDEKDKQEFQASIRIKKDSLIWMSMSMIGIEGVRVFANPDSFFLLNKLANEYTAHDFNFVRNWILFPVNFNMLEEIILGTKISINEKASVANREDSSTALYFESDKLLEKIWVDTTHYTIKKILLKDKLLNQNMTITFDAYNYSETKPFSYRRSIVINRDSTVLKLNIEFTKINFDGELTYPFEVSEKYKRVE